ncbi:MAG: creatininase family protein, partial [Alphaproteobacteria bacterium]|nr:creatininase family protein [Alphaproteobacteria bacterium]
GAFDTSQGNMRYPGTITLREETFTALLEDIARSYLLHGFKTVLLIGDHGGSQEALKRVAAALPGVVALTGYYNTDNGQTAALQKQGFTAEQIGQHAGMLDTSELFAVYPAGVRLEALKNSANPGGSGAPGLSTKELGRVLLQLKVDAAH